VRRFNKKVSPSPNKDNYRLSKLKSLLETMNNQEQKNLKKNKCRKTRRQVKPEKTGRDRIRL
jgi:hypothetical protein